VAVVLVALGFAAFTGHMWEDYLITFRSSLNLATRLNRTITDQLTVHLTRSGSNGKKVLLFCGDDEPEELGGQITRTP
jgi:hypothetical protein